MHSNQNEHIEEHKLWDSFLKGDDKSLEIIYRRFFDELYNYGIKWLNDISLTEDSIQDLFVKLLRTRKNLSATTSIKYYLFRAFRSIVLDKLKAKSKTDHLDEAGKSLFVFELSPEKNMIMQEENTSLQLRLTAALDALTPRQREAIFLRYIEGFSYEQVAAMMDLTTKGTYKLMARAIDALKEQLKGTAWQIFMPAGLLIPLLKNILKMMG
ncbi:MULTISPECIES: RNA polymerase sigma factor [Niastella]|uniref:Sigma-70 family RNA polymerase sigma factor n=1 Tax=Niastella soli TaxID=2821487 RepID=A0ABS3YW13_9BACT|nr:sigma-70 family RNA polymerase sigma factor [Niastella soli]MBO9201595.1 sigma-70 family RNA polymerase sigma factor [Niastella soli]